MVEALSNVMTAFGLSTSAGLNAYLPLLIVALTARFTNLIQLNEPWNVLTSWWVIGVLVVLLLIEMTVDKIPAVDTVNDIIQTVGRPAAGAILFAANSGVVGELHPAFALVAGLLLAGGVHAAKTTVRPVVTASTGGMGNWAVSIIEDILAFIGTVMAILLPLLLFLTVIFLAILYFWWRNRRRRERPATV
ncbi:MAG TPA: DUF4126 domain-containing protein [Anaerolineae bacterium]|nr:DUF4126 domain-containing protein [Anaerolineae bacterium]MCB0223087.1 DUF4126 domain-containing protein [Anaerolineae bacterium]MCB9106008.1 DUF4126 domain-containing protein [Anaerolineales bacterium]HRV94453.1 DUF4126 domain-containing protein [Anaerolineae bacterium]